MRICLRGRSEGYNPHTHFDICGGCRDLGLFYELIFWRYNAENDDTGRRLRDYNAEIMGLAGYDGTKGISIQMD